MTDIMREEGEIFALEQLLSEKRQLVCVGNRSRMSCRVKNKMIC